MLLFFGLLVFQIVDRMLYYYSWPMTVNMKMNFNRTLKFPAITLCNQNAFKASLAADLGRYRLLEAMHSSDGTVNTTFILKEGGNISLENLYLSSAHQKEDLIFECIWKGNKCGPDDFEISLTDHGVCYTWNKKDVSVSSPGVENGLRLKLNVEQNEYMPGPHNSAGLKFLLHDGSDIPMVHDLGQAVSIGSHVFIGVKLQEVNNLPEPHGKCSERDLKYLERYSKIGCKMDCLSTLAEETCGCRHIYMPHKHGQPEICDIYEYYTCLEQLISSFMSLAEQSCNCPIPCSMHDFETDLSYATISEYAIDKFLNKNNSVSLAKKLIQAKEVTSRMDHVKFEKLHEVAEDFEQKFEEIEFLFENELHDAIHTVEHSLEEESDHLTSVCAWKLFVFEYQEYVVLKSFVRYRDAFEERHAHIVALGYKEYILSIEHKIKYLQNLDMSKTSLRESMYLDTQNVLDNRIEIIQRTISNYTRLIKGYDTGKKIFNYKYKNLPKPDNAYVIPKHLLKESLILNNDTVEMYKMHLHETIDVLNSLKRLNNESYLFRNVNASDLETSIQTFQTAIENWLNARQFVYNEVIENPLNVLKIRKDEFERTCYRLKDVIVSATTNIESIDTKIETVEETLFEPIHVGHHLVHEYLHDGDGLKYKIAENFTSGEILQGTSNLKTLLLELLTEESALRNILVEMKSLAIQIHKTVTEDEDSFTYYNYTGNVQFLQNFTDVLIEIENNYTEYIESVKFYDIVGEKGLEFVKSTDDVIAYFQEYLSTLNLDAQYIRENFAQIDVFYRQMNYEEITQQVAFDTFSLFCDIGGSMGLFLGASLLSLCELLDLIWINVIKTRKVNSKEILVAECDKLHQTDSTTS
ncbi:degenerin-like protein del-10 [Mytilus edulis]|uniref:degenerin-like protein del-10 n=1 Tax=Mytilus edulis TaxID=6550 RepID=UPI0039EFCF0E